MPQPLTDEALAAMAAGVELEIETQEPDTTQALAALTTERDAAIADRDAAATAHATQLATVVADHATALAEASVQMAKFVEIARNSVKTMGIHFGVDATSVAAFDADQILVEHARLADLFKSKFKVGGVAATTPEVTTKAKTLASPMFAALLKSTAK